MILAWKVLWIYLGEIRHVKYFSISEKSTLATTPATTPTTTTATTSTKKPQRQKTTKDLSIEGRYE